MLAVGSKRASDLPEKTNSICYYIVGCNGPLAGRRFDLSEKQPSLEFGRETDEVRIPEGTQGVGRHHCRVILKAGKPYLIDLNSTYGTYFIAPWQRLDAMKEYELRDQIEFCLASSAVTFRIVDSARLK